MQLTVSVGISRHLRIHISPAMKKAVEDGWARRLHVGVAIFHGESGIIEAAGAVRELAETYAIAIPLCRDCHHEAAFPGISAF